ncbi:MAG: PilZ domain-containing protein [bacterium]
MCYHINCLIMIVLRTIINDPAVLRERFLPDMSHGGLFVPLATPLKVGEEVGVWFDLRSHAAELHIMGIVYWIRLGSRPLGQKPVLGAGIGFKSGQEEQLAFLERVIAGEAEPFPRQRSPRTPLLPPWRCQIAGIGTTEFRPAQLVDISKGGALAVVGRQTVEVAGSLLLALPWHSPTRHEMRVAWERASDIRSRIGLSRLGSGQVADREWATLVSAARKAFKAQVWDRGEAS